MASVETRSFEYPDRHMQPGRGDIAIVNVAGVTLKRIIFHPGWRWTEDVGPTADTDLCPVRHVFAHVGGKLAVKMADGSEYEFGPGDISVIPPGHDAWVVGEEPAVIIDQSPVEP